jgi:hypothetical protein
MIIDSPQAHMYCDVEINSVTHEVPAVRVPREGYVT